MDTPRKLVAAAFELLQANDWKGLAAVCDPLSLRSFKAEMLEEFDDEDFLTDKVDSGLAVELDDDQYADYCKYLSPVSMLRVEFPMLSSVAELRALDSFETFALWLEGKASGGRSEDDADTEAWIPNKEVRALPENEVIGCVFASPDIAHVLYRRKLPATAHDGYRSWLSKARAEHQEFMAAMYHHGDPSLITCRRQSDGTWRLVAKRHFMLFGALQVTELRADDHTT